MAISRIGMQTHVYVCIFVIWTSNHATIILCVYVRFTFKWNVDCMDCILMMWGIRFADYQQHVCHVYIKKNYCCFRVEKRGCYKRNHTSSSMSRDSIVNTRKTASRNYCKTLSAIQRSDQKLWTFSAFITVWRDKTSSSMSRDSTGNTRKTASGNYYKTLSAIKRSDQKLWPF
jgi:hypothetical protein